MPALSILFTSASPRVRDGNTRPASIRRQNPGQRPGAGKKKPLPRRRAPGGKGCTDSKRKRSYERTLITMRRFCARSALVLFGATGLSGP